MAECGNPAGSVAQSDDVLRVAGDCEVAIRCPADQVSDLSRPGCACGGTAHLREPSVAVAAKRPVESGLVDLHAVYVVPPVRDLVRQHCQRAYCGNLSSVVAEAPNPARALQETE